METLLAEARGGNLVSAIMAAMVIHNFPEEAQRVGIHTLYEPLLLQSLQSTDAEVLACLAEELMTGQRLAADGRMAYRAAEKADTISGFMGSYVIGHVVSKTKPDLALKKLRKGRKIGHVPSWAVSIRIVTRRIPVFGEPLRWCLTLPLSFYAIKPILKKDMRRLWRGVDVFGRQRDFLDLFGPDRKRPFARIDALLSMRHGGKRGRYLFL